MENNKKLYKIIMTIVSVQTILMGILFIVQVLRIYYGNSKEFTSAICGRYLLQILPVIIVWIILIVFSYLYHKKSNSKDNNISKITEMGKLKLYEHMCPEYSKYELDEIYKLLKKEKTKRYIAWIINIAIIIICSCMGLMYLLNVNHFLSSGDLTEQAIKMTIHLIPWVIISFLGFIGYAFFEEYISKKACTILLEVIKTNGKATYKEIVSKFAYIYVLY